VGKAMIITSALFLLALPVVLYWLLPLIDAAAQPVSPPLLDSPRA